MAKPLDRNPGACRRDLSIPKPGDNIFTLGFSSPTSSRVVMVTGVREAGDGTGPGGGPSIYPVPESRDQGSSQSEDRSDVVGVWGARGLIASKFTSSDQDLFCEGGGGASAAASPDNQ